MHRKIPETITEEELLELLKAEEKENYRLAYALGFYQAMRISEIINLLPENIDINQRIIKIKQAKGSKDRNIPISPNIIKGLRKNIPIGVGIRMLQKRFSNQCLKVLNKKLNFHCLRHSGATFYLNVKKWDLRSIQVFLGHSRLDSTEVYTHVKPESLIEKMWS